MKLRRFLTLLVPVSMAVLFAASPGAFADPTWISASAAVFTGDQSEGIWPDLGLFPLRIWTCPPIYTFHVNTLTTDIAPAAGVPGIQITSQGANGGDGDWSLGGDGGNGGDGAFGGLFTIDVVPIPSFPFFELKFIFQGPKVNFDGGDYRIITSGTGAHGISARSIGGNGGSGGWAVGALGLGPAWGGHGGDGGYGAPVTVVSAGDIETSGDSSYGIFAESRGGSGGNGGWAASGSYTEGGDGGKGGGGGTVTIFSSSHIQTTGNLSDGIVGQSLGGAGGSGGDGGSLVGQGGGTLGSGPGGRVDINNSGNIETSGIDSHGIFAQSIGGLAGGAGGAGGFVAWGGSGNSAGDGGKVVVGNSGNITTTGKGSDSIFAQSIGGGGGSAVASGGVVTLGGDGAAGGNGGEVIVTNSGRLETTRAEARGILAQSIGAGGGAGGSAGGLGSVGGRGSSTGDGGSVTVHNSGTIITHGDGSDSIFAESVGGGGGVTGGPGGESVFGLFTSIGGDGAGGGSGGLVTVTNTGALTTSGVDASGILAQSVGGGGGNGGQAFDVGLGFTYVAGGNSELGGNGGQVNVNGGTAPITTAGDLSHGIHAVSIGGGGGTGGNTLSVTGSVQYSASISQGGLGGGGGSGGAVDLTSGNRIITQGEQAHGLYAQSVGGGGGSGGNVVAWNAVIGGIEEVPGVVVELNLGGKGGTGGSGGAVSVTSTGDIDTSKFRSYGILAQSVGGGGGDGGNITAGTIAFESATFTGALGSEGGEGGNGAAASVNSSSNITTAGDFAIGILGQSIGGGGGSGGNNTTWQIDIGILTALKDLIPSLDCSSSFSTGATGGSGGDGWTVDITSTGTIATKGQFAHGIVAQSIGGGGGSGGDSTSTSLSLGVDPGQVLDFAGFLDIGSDLWLGSDGGAGGDGGIAHVVNHGNIVTEGNFANGIVAQSIGGGGGTNGSRIADEYGLVNPLGTSTKTLRGRSSASGDGGAVTVENSANITTHGGFAHGILAQSVGGGGGFAGISEVMGASSLGLGLGADGVFAQNTGFGVGFAGSVGGSGDAGAVNVTHTGSITTFGDTSHGILAQSVTGSGTAGPVTVTLASDIVAHGVDSDGIRAQSLGRGGRGDISINNGGRVRGGSGSGAGVRIDGGANNTLTNTGGGRISALSGKAILGGSGNDTIINRGIVVGAVELGGGMNAFHNEHGARFDTGLTIDLGAGNTLTNEGILSPGGRGAILNTTLKGNLVQSDLGVLEIDIGGFASGLFDSLTITGDLTGGTEGTSPSPAGGTIQFSFLPGYDLFADLAPGQSRTLEFLNVEGNPDFLSASVFSYEFFGGPSGFSFNVFRLNEGLYLQAGNVVPVPGACLLAFLGLSVAGWRLRRKSEV